MLQHETGDRSATAWWRHRAPASFAALVAVLVVAYALTPTGGVRQTIYLGAPIGAACISWWGMRRMAPRLRRPWRWVVLAISLSAAGDIALFAQTVLLHRPEPDVSIADPLWMGSYVALVIGLCASFLGGRAFLRDPESQIDTASTVVVGLLIVWQFVIGDASDGSTALGVRLIWAAYPLLDLFLVSVLSRIVLMRRSRSTASLLLFVAVLLWLGADFAYLTASNVAVDLQPWTDAGWMIGFGLLGLAAWAVAPVTPRAAGDDDDIGPLRLSMATVPILVPSVLVAWGDRTGFSLDPPALVLSTALLVTFAFVRSLRVTRRTVLAHEQVRRGARYYRTLATNASDAVVVVDRTGLVLHDAPAFRRMVGLPDTDLLGFYADDLLCPGNPEAVRALLSKAAVTPGRVVAGELVHRRAGAHDRWLAVRARDLTDDPDVGGVVMNLHDISDRKEVEEALHEQAFHDSLTGLANRALFRNRVEHALDNAARTAMCPAVIFIDLDAFKDVNDSLGHDTGDRLLEEVARRLVASVRPGDTVARLGGDEFAVLIDQSARPLEDATTVAERLLESLQIPATIDDRLISISGSVGIDVARPGDDVTSLLRNADMAMYRAKAGGKGCWARYDPTMRTATLARMQMEADLLGALDAGQFELVYQPVVNIRDSQLNGFEALLRWNHPMLGTVAPDDFIPILEESGRIVAVGGWVLEEACRTAAQWHRELAHTGPFTMSVNLSAVQLASPLLVDHVADVLRTTGLEATSLVLEMTETTLVQEPTSAAETLRQLRELGVKIAIDDFGTGYSSLSYLRQFPADILKIDRSFISTIRDDSELPAIVRGVLELARTLGLETVAEGIELDCQRQHLDREACELGQGFLFARPLPRHEARLLVAERAAGVGPRSLPA